MSGILQNIDNPLLRFYQILQYCFNGAVSPVYGVCRLCANLKNCRADNNSNSIEISGEIGILNPFESLRSYTLDMRFPLSGYLK